MPSRMDAKINMMVIHGMVILPGQTSAFPMPIKRKLDDFYRICTIPGLVVGPHGPRYILGSFRYSIIQQSPTLEPSPVATRSRRVSINGGCRYPNPLPSHLAICSLGQNYVRKRGRKRCISLKLDGHPFNSSWTYQVYSPQNLHQGRAGAALRAVPGHL